MKVITALVKVHKETKRILATYAVKLEPIIEEQSYELNLLLVK